MHEHYCPCHPAELTPENGRHTDCACIKTLYVDGRSIAASAELFRDTAHLNPTGARLLAEALAKASRLRTTAASGAGS